MVSKPEGRRAVDDDVVVLLLRPAVEHLAQGVLAADAAEELVLRGREVDVRRRHVDVLGLRLLDDVLERERGVQEHVGDRHIDVAGVEAKADGEVGLRVHVDAEDLVAQLGEGTGEVDRRGRLAHATLLVRDRDDPCQDTLPVCSGSCVGAQPPQRNLPNGASAHHGSPPRVVTREVGADAWAWSSRPSQLGCGQ